MRRLDARHSSRDQIRVPAKSTKKAHEQEEIQKLRKTDDERDHCCRPPIVSPRRQRVRHRARRNGKCQIECAPQSRGNQKVHVRLLLSKGRQSVAYKTIVMSIRRLWSRVRWRRGQKSTYTVSLTDAVFDPIAVIVHASYTSPTGVTMCGALWGNFATTIAEFSAQLPALCIVRLRRGNERHVVSMYMVLFPPDVTVFVVLVFVVDVSDHRRKSKASRRYVREARVKNENDSTRKVCGFGMWKRVIRLKKSRPDNHRMYDNFENRYEESRLQPCVEYARVCLLSAEENICMHIGIQRLK